MPDPLYLHHRLVSEFEAARATAERFGVRLWREDELMFLDWTDRLGNRYLARCDFNRYPSQPPDVVFLDPAEKKEPRRAPPSADRRHWPQTIRLQNDGGGLHLCLAGTRWYLRGHPDPGYVLSPSRLVGTLAFYGQQGVQARIQQRRRMRR